MESRLSNLGNPSPAKNDATQLSINNVDLKLLRVFKCVVEAGGFTSASVELNIGLAAISKQISDLEIRLGMTLCSRGRDGFSLTEHGISVYQATLELFGAINQFRDKLHSTRNDILGEINISLIDNIITDPNSPITKAVQTLHRSAPKVSIRLQTTSLDDLERGINEGRFTCGIAPVYQEKMDFDYYPLYIEESQLYCGQEHEFFHMENELLTLPRLKQAVIVNHAYSSLNYARKPFNFHSSHVQAVQVEAVAMLLLTGCFIGYLPSHYAQRYVEQGQLRAIGADDLRISVPISLVLRKGRKINVIIKLFMEALGL
ncbi:LysR family transcriptional regulator [Musicola paradisiaca]|uniref:Transcriptional regulator, LysR family n=1 Tax=Musicola paradisiaca (strain Ech703) TaxID=579405 RepID=C6C3I0_MUSP7|nr:LysR family transcriptional regulator [Musicola paradisiaca]ACS87278.1 transcriptional regulator, LysR family [Musicola paradisiaca Ech703]